MQRTAKFGSLKSAADIEEWKNPNLQHQFLVPRLRNELEHLSFKFEAQAKYAKSNASINVVRTLFLCVGLVFPEGMSNAVSVIKL